ncbi:hypothetical protein [Sorangium sp. So ce131]|uniref:hypothetical protein n=1 Tax=Sorangium sp. So ce131 TaxID=3133282 RepID=UPI003F61C780
MMTACGSDSLPGDVTESSELAAPSAGPATENPEPIPKELRAAYIAAVQAGASEAYAPVAVGPARFAMENPTQRLTAVLERAGVVVLSSGQAWSLSMRTAALGCEGSVAALPDAEPDAVESDSKRVRYVRENLEEWYLNGPLGLEQGFVVAQAPACRGTKVIGLELGGDLHAELDDADGDGRGDALRLVDAEGRRALSYTDLFVRDATGKVLSAWLSLEGGQVAIHVDDEGAAYPIEVDPLIANQQAKLVASDGAVGDYFGASVAIAGDTAVVGAAGDDIDWRGSQGSAYVFVRSGTSWVQQAKLVASDGESPDEFGASVAIAGDTVVVGAQYSDIDLSASQGSAYVFVRTGTSWTQQAKLVASDGEGLDRFGVSVAIAGDTAVVGAVDDDGRMSHGHGSAYVFVRSGASWTQQAKLVASDGAGGDYFGVSIAIAGDTAVVGAMDDTIDGRSHQGSAYVFVRSGTSWTQQAQLVASDGAVWDQFGVSVAIAGDAVVVGARLDDVDGRADQGSAYVFVRSGTSWAQQAQLVASDGAAGDYFGSSVAIVGDTAVVGAVDDETDGRDQQGSAYVFVRSGTSWAQQAHLVASDGAAGDYFGGSVALAGNTAIAGAMIDDDARGSVYAFILSAGVGTPCTSGAQCATGLCVDGVCCDTACGGGVPSDCQACSVAAGAAESGICGLVAAGAECRGAAGACDVAEACDGASDTCPVDARMAAGTECRVSAGDCDVPEACDGVADTCPTDATAPSGTLCSDGICVDGTCMSGPGGGGPGGGGPGGGGPGGGGPGGSGVGGGGPGGGGPGGSDVGGGGPGGGGPDGSDVGGGGPGGGGPDGNGGGGSGPGGGGSGGSDVGGSGPGGGGPGGGDSGGGGPGGGGPGGGDSGGGGPGGGDSGGGGGASGGGGPGGNGVGGSGAEPDQNSPSGESSCDCGVAGTPTRGSSRAWGLFGLGLLALRRRCVTRGNRS